MSSFQKQLSSQGQQKDIDSVLRRVYAGAEQAKALFVAPNGGKDIGSKAWQEAFLDTLKDMDDCFLHALGKKNDDGSVDNSAILAVAATCGATIKSYYDAYTEMPEAGMLASALESMISLTDESTPAGAEMKQLLDAAGDNIGQDSTNIDTLARNIMLVMPATLIPVTARACSHMPGNHEEQRIYSMEMVSGSDFADVKKGDLLDEAHIAQMSYMAFRFLAATGDGSTLTFNFATATDTAGLVALPAKKGSPELTINGAVVAKETAGNFTGSVTISSTTYALSGAVDLANGAYTITSAPALPAGVEVDVKFDVDIEKNPTLIPEIEAYIEYWTVKPHENALRATSTIQAFFLLKSEHGLDVTEIFLKELTSLLAKNRDNRRLRDFYRVAQGNHSFNRVPAVNINQRDHDETFQAEIITIDSYLIDQTGVAGLHGFFAGRGASNYIRTLPKSIYQPLPNYQAKKEAHLAGFLDGKPFVIDPNMEKSMPGYDNFICCYAKGQNFGESGYVTGTSVPPTYYSHSIGENLKKSNTIYEKTFDDVHPNNGAQYFTMLEITTS